MTPNEAKAYINVIEYNKADDPEMSASLEQQLQVEFIQGISKSLYTSPNDKMVAKLILDLWKQKDIKRW
jgi:hypothetical protein